MKTAFKLFYKREIARNSRREKKSSTPVEDTDDAFNNVREMIVSCHARQVYHEQSQFLLSTTERETRQEMKVKQV